MTAYEHPDATRLQNLVYELVSRYVHPDTRQTLPGLLRLAWTPPIGLLTARQPHDEGGHGGHPGSRPPMRLDLEAHVMSCLDLARELADDLGCYVNSGDGELALRRLPALLEPTYSADCDTCGRCSGRNQEPCGCRHRQVTRTIAVCHSTIRTALGFQSPRIDWLGACCPDCGRVGKVSVRGEKVWCRQIGCDYSRQGVFSILAVAS